MCHRSFIPRGSLVKTFDKAGINGFHATLVLCPPIVCVLYRERESLSFVVHWGFRVPPSPCLVAYSVGHVSVHSQVGPLGKSAHTDMQPLMVTFDGCTSIKGEEGSSRHGEGRRLLVVPKLSPTRT